MHVPNDLEDKRKTGRQKNTDKADNDLGCYKIQIYLTRVRASI